MPELRTETMTVNMGPQHPSTHGLLRLPAQPARRAAARAGARWRDRPVGRRHDWLPAYRHREDCGTEEVAAGHPARRAYGLPGCAVEQPRVRVERREAARPRDARARAGHP